jgi:rSAM/selenodomain-associated transferase 1
VRVAGSDVTPILAIVAKAPRAGDVKTRLCPPLSHVEAAALSAAFLGDTVDLVRRCPGARGAFVYTPADREPYFAGLAPEFLRVAQQGPDLGARMQHAFTALFAIGAPAVIALGADIPTLPIATLAEAVRRLADDQVDVVLGPSDDGGYYLIGLRRSQPALFEDIAWSTSAVCEQTLAAASAAGLAVSLLPAWFDVDTAADLERLDATLDEPGVRAPRTRARRAAQGASA